MVKAAPGWRSTAIKSVANEAVNTGSREFSFMTDEHRVNGKHPAWTGWMDRLFWRRHLEGARGNGKVNGADKAADEDLDTPEEIMQKLKKVQKEINGTPEDALFKVLKTEGCIGYGSLRGTFLEAAKVLVSNGEAQYEKRHGRLVVAYRPPNRVRQFLSFGMAR